MQKQKNSGDIELKLTVKNTGKETLRFQDAYGEIEHCSMSLPAFASIQPGNQATIQMHIDMLAVAAAGFKRIEALDSRRFHRTSGNITWKNASLRTWLNYDFYTAAFDAEEKALILQQKVDTLAGNDKVFLLSRDEVEAYFPTAAQRRCEATAYAASRNAYVNAKTGCSWWLLRTSGIQKGTVMSVNSDGTIDYNGGKVESDRGTVRPAMWIRTTG